MGRELGILTRVRVGERRLRELWDLWVRENERRVEEGEGTMGRGEWARGKGFSGRVVKGFEEWREGGMNEEVDV